MVQADCSLAGKTCHLSLDGACKEQNIYLFFKRFCVVSLLLLSVEILCHDFSWHDMTVLPLS